MAGVYPPFSRENKYLIAIYIRGVFQMSRLYSFIK